MGVSVLVVYDAALLLCNRLACCSVLQCVAVCCSVLQCVAVCCSELQCAAACCSVLQCVAACCGVLQCVAISIAHVQIPFEVIMVPCWLKLKIDN